MATAVQKIALEEILGVNEAICRVHSRSYVGNVVVQRLRSEGSACRQQPTLHGFELFHFIFIYFPLIIRQQQRRYMDQSHAS